MKSEYVKRMFSLALYDLLKKRKIDEIHVQEICDGCGMSKRTFYNHFQDKYDLAAYLYNAISTDQLSGFLTEDYFGEMAAGNSALNLAEGESAEVLRRLLVTWASAHNRVSVNMSASEDINSLLPVLEKVNFAGRRKLLQNRLAEQGKTLDETDLSLAAEICYLIFLRYCDKWRPLYTQELPEAEARRVLQLTQDMIAFWVDHGEPVAKE